MFEIEWKRYSSTEIRYTFGTYLFKRKGTENNYRYELWENGQLLDNTLDKFGVLKTIRDGYLKKPPNSKGI